MGGLYYGNDHHAPILKVSNTENHELNLGICSSSESFWSKREVPCIPIPLVLLAGRLTQGFTCWTQKCLKLYATCRTSRSFMPTTCRKPIGGCGICWVVPLPRMPVTHKDYYIFLVRDLYKQSKESHWHPGRGDNVPRYLHLGRGGKWQFCCAFLIQSLRFKRFCGQTLVECFVFVRTWTKQRLLAWRRNVSNFTWPFHLNTSAVCWKCLDLYHGCRVYRCILYTHPCMFIATFSDLMPQFVQNRKIRIQIANSRCDNVSCLPQFICFATCSMWAVCLWKMNRMSCYAVERLGLNMF